MWTWIKLAASSIGNFLLPFVKIFLSSLGPVVAKAAMAAVTTTAESLKGATGAEKRDAAYKLIVDELKQQGVTVAESMINAAIEAAVQKLKSSSS